MAYQTAAQIRSAVPVLADTTAFPDIKLTDLVGEFEEIAEEYRGVAFEPRTVTEVYRFDVSACTDELQLRWPLLRSVTTVTGDGVTITAANYELDKPVGVIWYATGFAARADIAVTYVHGYDAPPKGVIRACREYVRSCALSDKSSVPRDVIAQSFDGGYTRFSTPDWDAGRPTGWLEVDRLLNAQRNYRIPAVG